MIAAVLSALAIAGVAGQRTGVDAAVLPLLGQAKANPGCSGYEEPDRDVFCVSTPRAATRETVALYKAELERQGWLVGAAPEVDLGFVKMKDGEFCKGGMLRVFVEDRADIEAAQGILIFSFDRDDECETLQ